MARSLTRRSFVAGAVLGSFGARLRAAPQYSFVQYHNQTAASPLHQQLVAMWAAIGTETGGRVGVRIFPNNNGISGSDPAALRALMAGDIHFFTLMGGILGTVVPAAEVQQMPFVFRSASHAHKAMDGPLGAYLREEMAAKGLVGFAGGAFDNGMRQIGGTKRAILRPGDLEGMRMRVPAGEIVADAFRTLGAEPVTINSDGIHAALASGQVDAQENPLALMELFKLDEVIRYVSLTNHMWSGFNLLAHRPTWLGVQADVRTVIERNVGKYVRAQRRDQATLNAAARLRFATRGLLLNEVDPAPFRAQLAGFYARWRERLGSRCWSLLNDARLA